MAAPSAISSEPLRSGSTPKCFGSYMGVHFVPVRNAIGDTSAKKLNACVTSTITIPSVVRIETMLKAVSRMPTSRSLRCLRSCSFALSKLANAFLVFCIFECYVAHLRHERGRVLEIERHESVHLRTLQSGLAHVDHERA